MTAKVGVIGGSAAAGFLDLQDAQTIYGKTLYGLASSPITYGQLSGRSVHLIMRQGIDNEIVPHRVNHRANISALADMGCEFIISLALVGAITDRLTPGSITVPDQLIDYTYGRDHTFFDNEWSAPVHQISFAEPYSRKVRRALLDAADQIRVAATDGGVHGVGQGPRLDTRAEIDRFAWDGCDTLDMNCMPEAGLARELGIEFGCLALVGNRVAGRNHKDASRGSQNGMPITTVADDVKAVLKTAVGLL